MKKIDPCKLKEIEERHWEYCKCLRPKGLDKSSQMDKFKKLCIDNPFDFSRNYGEFPYLKNELLELSEVDLKGQYEDFRSNKLKKDWDGVKLIDALGINVCPYCGINYFSIVSKANSGIVSEATFDHYLPKSKYPMLALNLYNLIPSCKNCNSTFKLDDPQLIINPFFEAVEDLINFKLLPGDTISNILNSDYDLQIEIEQKLPDDEKSKNHIDVLALKNRYNYFSDIAKSIIKKKVTYTEEYVGELSDIKGLCLSPEDIKKMLMYQDIYNDNEPFLKFKNDIWESL